MQKMFQGKNASSSKGKVVVEVKSHCRCECSRCESCYKKHNHKRTHVLGKRTKEEQRYCKLRGGQIKEEYGKNHLVVAKGTNYQ
jgi:hypothetical protein